MSLSIRELSQHLPPMCGLITPLVYMYKQNLVISNQALPGVISYVTCHGNLDYSSPYHSRHSEVQTKLQKNNTGIKIPQL